MRGWPDYTRVTGLVDNYDEYGQNYPIGGGDIAARLGSIKTHDMRGRVWWMDDFDAAGMHWRPTSVGAGGAQHLVSNYVRNGEQALGLQANTGALRESSVERILSLPRTVNMGVELSVANEVNYRDLQAIIFLDDAVQQTWTRLRINEITGNFEYTDEFNTFQDSGVDTGISNNLLHFHTWKVVFNYATDEYLRLLYDDQEVDLTGTQMSTIGTTGNRWFGIQLHNTGDGVANTWAIFDDAIVTVMEPD